MNNILIFCIALILSSIGHLATDIYLPSMPTMANYFNASNTLVQLTFSFYMLSFCLTPIFAGPISDRIGRKYPMLIGISIGLFATFLCIFAKNIYFLIFARFLQGIGLGVLVCVSRAILPDHFQGKELAKNYSFLTMFMPVILAVGPSLGAFIHKNSSWHGVFVFMLCYLLVITFIIYYFFEDKKRNFTLKTNSSEKFIHVYQNLLTNKKFILFSLCSVFIFIGISSYLTVNSFLFQQKLGLTPTETAKVTLILFVTVFVMGYVNTKLILLFKPKKILFLFNPLIILAGIILIYTEIFNNINIYTLLLSLLLYFATIPTIFSNAGSLAMSNIQGNFGAAMALINCLQFLGGAVTSFIISFTNSTSPLPLGITFLLVGIGSLLILVIEGQKVNEPVGSTASVKSV